MRVCTKKVTLTYLEIQVELIIVCLASTPVLLLAQLVEFRRESSRAALCAEKGGDPPPLTPDIDVSRSSQVWIYSLF